MKFTYFYDQQSKGYPNKIKKVMGDKAPKFLEMQGNKLLLNKKSVGFSGARECSLRSEAVCEDCVKQLIEKNIVIVSGGAKGIDTTAHYTALANGGSTIVVLPHGIEAHKIPRSLLPVWNWDRVLVLSIFRPKDEWQAWRALERNKIIVALSFATLIVESNETGGTMHTGTYSIKTAKQPTYAIRYQDMTVKGRGNPLLFDMGAKPIGRDPNTKKTNLKGLLMEAR